LGRDHPLIEFNRLLPIAHIIDTMDMQRSDFGDLRLPGSIIAAGEAPVQFELSVQKTGFGS
jgi:hypothetical protein